MNIFEFINELKSLKCDEDGIQEFEPLVIEGLSKTKATDIDCLEAHIIGKEGYLDGWMGIIKFEIDFKFYEIKLSCLFDKPRHRIELFQENKSGEMIKMPLPDEIYDEDY